MSVGSGWRLSRLGEFAHQRGGLSRAEVERLRGRLVVDRLLQGDVHRVVEQLFCLRQRDRSGLQQAPHISVDDLIELVVGYDAVQKTEVKRVVGRQNLAEERKLLGMMRPHAARQQPRASAVQRKASQYENLREPGARCGHDEVAAQRSEE